ncbi:MAG: flagellar export protein FliJ [Phycisphaeraceae bacterium]|nr:flagellar export protein FliJ [Phycisphaeraceae bacterium]
MAQFIFRYQTLLDHRRTLEDQAQRELAKLLRTQAILHDQLRLQQQTIRDSKRDLADSLLGKVDLSAVGQFARYSGAVADRARQVVAHLAKLEKSIEESRKLLLDATRKRKALELLHDKHEAAWRRQQEQRELAELDDLTTQRYARLAMGVTE